MRQRLTVVTPWYPTPSQPAAGAFVRSMVEAATRLFAGVEVIHGDEWLLPDGRHRQRALRRSLRHLLAASPSSVYSRVSDEYGLRRVPVLFATGNSYAELARRFEDSMRRAVPGGFFHGEVVHAHVGLRGGWPAVQLARPGARVFVTEHASFLPRVLRQADSRAMYDEVIERCTAFFCVSEVLRARLLAAFPHHRSKIEVLPNVVDFEAIPIRPSPVQRLRRWLYVGNLREAKGVRLLLEAFAVCQLDEPELELTIVGDGPLAGQLRDRIGELGLARSVRMVHGQPHDRVLTYMRDHDLLVHPSRHETFGMTVIEAIACGTPVLVTACGGPEETLSGLGRSAGALIPLGDGVAELVRGYRELRRNMHHLDLSSARAALQSRYGVEAIRKPLEHHYFGVDPRGRSES